MAKNFMLLFIKYLPYFTVKDFIWPTRAGANMYMCTRVVIYACLCAYTDVFAYGYSYGDTVKCIYMFVSLSACWSFHLPFQLFLNISLHHLHYSLYYYIVMYVDVAHLCQVTILTLIKMMNWTELNQWYISKLYQHWFRSWLGDDHWPLLLTWINFNPSMDK